MPQFSIVLATFNEEKNIAKCLDSVKKIADEIIIVDGSSTDRTVEIAKGFGAKVTVRDNPKIFHINKQIAINKATKDWIIQLDADENLTEKSIEEIREVTKKTDKNGFWIPRKNFFLGRFLMKGGQYPDYTLRVYRKGKGKLPQKDVHEQTVVKGEVGHLKNPLLHYPYKDFKEYYLKWNRYNSIFADQIKEERKAKNIIGKIWMIPSYLLVLPIFWFIKIYLRHKGILDMWPGFVFALFSALRYPKSFIYSY
jgi:glycosyltransferase involved in cell wall biosynthesis